MSVNATCPALGVEALQGVEQRRIVDHARRVLRVTAVSELGDQGEDIIDSIFLDVVGGTLSLQ